MLIVSVKLSLSVLAKCLARKISLGTPIHGEISSTMSNLKNVILFVLFVYVTMCPPLALHCTYFICSCHIIAYLCLGAWNLHHLPSCQVSQADEAEPQAVLVHLCQMPAATSNKSLQSWCSTHRLIGQISKCI